MRGVLSVNDIIFMIWIKYPSYRSWRTRLGHISCLCCRSKFLCSLRIDEIRGTDTHSVDIFNIWFPSWTFTRARTSRGTLPYLVKTPTRRIAGTSTRALTWAGRNLGRAWSGRRKKMVPWQVKMYGLTTRSSLASGRQYSNTSKSFHQLLLFCRLMPST